MLWPKRFVMINLNHICLCLMKILFPFKKNKDILIKKLILFVQRYTHIFLGTYINIKFSIFFIFILISVSHYFFLKSVSILLLTPSGCHLQSPAEIYETGYGMQEARLEALSLYNFLQQCFTLFLIANVFRENCCKCYCNTQLSAGSL